MYDDTFVAVGSQAHTATSKEIQLNPLIRNRPVEPSTWVPNKLIAVPPMNAPTMPR